MSSPTVTSDAVLKLPGLRSQRGRVAALMPAGGGDAGQPVADPPPLVEPADERVTGRRPQRRSFLAPRDPAVEAEQIVSFETSEFEAAEPDVFELEVEELPEELIEPVAAEPLAPSPSRMAGLAHWPAHIWALVRIRLAVDPRARLSAWVAAAVVVGLVVALAYIAVMGPFSRVRDAASRAASQGVPSDPAARVAYWRSGARAGDSNAELQLAILYAKGDGVPQDYGTSATWFRAAADHGIARAQYDLGVLYERGRGVPVDLTEAVKWYVQSAQAGYPLAQYNLAVFYTKGQGVRQDLPEAAVWYQRAAMQGVVQAMVNLGMMYEKGEGVAAAPVNAYAWYQAAGRRNNSSAAQRAEDLFKSLSSLDQVRAQALASDVDGSIHEPMPEHGETGAPFEAAPPPAGPGH